MRYLLVVLLVLVGCARHEKWPVAANNDSYEEAKKSTEQRVRRLIADDLAAYVDGPLPAQMPAWRLRHELESRARLPDYRYIGDYGFKAAEIDWESKEPLNADERKQLASWIRSKR